MAETGTATTQAFAYTWWVEESVRDDAPAVHEHFVRQACKKVEAQGFRVVGEPTVQWPERVMFLPEDPPEGWTLVVVRLEALPN